ncbi:hypothetical protein [Ornithinicoccus halotolerans]|uniref:hypothetical protein n=1 Tax=Ornithinicoccus halotolerans TaxID=1748220 RepID=UPI0012951249|nr:hypothetical protein [Ornithinicoccus halotolerans]
MKRSTWNRKIPGGLLLGLAILGIANGGNVPVMLLLGGLGLVLLLAGLLDKSEERV